jgi:hypothetical protein
MVVNAKDEELQRALDKGASTELPPSIPPGLLGELGADIRKTDDFKPSLSAGFLQESTWETRWLTIGLLYLLVLTSPIALWLLWREPKRTLWAKSVATMVGIAGYVAIFVATRR